MLRTDVRIAHKTESGENSMLGLAPRHLDLAEKMDALVARGISQRAADYDANASFPTEDFRDLHQAGLLLATLPEKDGGLGYGFDDGDPLSFFTIIERIATVSPATAHCYQVHCNALQILRAYGSDEQVHRFIGPTLEKTHVLVGAGSEPGGGRHSSQATPDEGGIRLTGVKHYATNATHSTWMTVHIRNATTGTMDTVVVNTSSDGLEIDAQVWNPTGMRACVSPLLRFSDCFVPQDCVLDGAEGFLNDMWLGKVNFGFTANYLGAAQGMYRFAREYLAERPSRDSETFQVILGAMKARIDAARLLFYNAVHVAKANIRDGLIVSNEAKWLAVETVNNFVTQIGQLIGSSGFFRTFPVERIIRDMLVHTIHRRHHVGATLVARKELGLPFDLNQS